MTCPACTVYGFGMAANPIPIHHRMTVGLIRDMVQRNEPLRLRAHEQRQVIEALVAYADRLDELEPPNAGHDDGCRCMRCREAAA